MESINEWLEKFISAWKAHDIETVLGLFADNIEYWETPFRRLADLDEIKKEWQIIRNQKDIQIAYDVFSKEGDNYTVRWELQYNDSNNLRNLKGVYLITLDSENKCNYFFHCGELNK